MTAATLADTIHQVASTDDPVALARLAQALRRANTGDRDAATVARSAEMKRQRLLDEN